MISFRCRAGRNPQPVHRRYCGADLQLDRRCAARGIEDMRFCYVLALQSGERTVPVGAVELAIQEASINEQQEAAVA
jgi:hypothetical protein